MSSHGVGATPKPPPSGSKDGSSRLLWLWVSLSPSPWWHRQLLGITVERLQSELLAPGRGFPERPRGWSGTTGRLEGAGEPCLPRRQPRPREPRPLAPGERLSVRSPHLLALQIARLGPGPGQGGGPCGQHPPTRSPTTACPWGDTLGWDPKGPSRAATVRWHRVARPRRWQWAPTKPITSPYGVLRVHRSRGPVPALRRAGKGRTCPGPGPGGPACAITLPARFAPCPHGGDSPGLGVPLTG